MPNMAAIAVTNAAAVAKSFDIGYPSSGQSPAFWVMTSESTFAFARPTLELTFRDNAAKDARKGILQLKCPYTITDPSTGLVKLVSLVPFNLDVTLPKNVPDVVKNDAIAFFQGVVASTLMRDCLRAGFSAT